MNFLKAGLHMQKTQTLINPIERKFGMIATKEVNRYIKMERKFIASPFFPTQLSQQMAMQ